MFVCFVLYMIEEPVENGCHEETVKAKNDQNKPNKEKTNCERPAETDIDNLLYWRYSRNYLSKSRICANVAAKARNARMAKSR